MYMKSPGIVVLSNFDKTEVYYEQQIKRELKGIHICGCRCNERLKAKTDGSTRLACTVGVGAMKG